MTFARPRTVRLGTPAHGRVDATPWAEAAIGDAVARRQLAQRVPVGLVLHLAGRSPRGPWHVGLVGPGGQIIGLKDQSSMTAAIDKALAVPLGPAR